MKKTAKKYPLLPFAQLVYDVTRWFPSIYFFEIKLRTKAISLEKATEMAYQVVGNHPVFQMRIDLRGQQYVRDEKVRLQTPYYKIKLWEEDSWLYVQVGANLVLGDGFSLLVLLDDIYRSYQGEALVKDDYWWYIDQYEQSKQELHYLNSKKWLENELADVAIPVRPTIDRRWLHPFTLSRIALYEVDYLNILESIRKFLLDNHITMDGFISLCTALAIAEYCGTNEAALTWAHNGRGATEQNIVGCLHRDIPFKIKASADKSNLIRQARNQIRSGIAHSDYPYTLTKPNTDRWNYAVNVLRVPDMQTLVDQFPIPFELLSVPQQKFAYAILDVEIHESAERLNIVYRYSATHYKESSIKKFAALVRKYAEWLLKE